MSSNSSNSPNLFTYKTITYTIIYFPFVTPICPPEHRGVLRGHHYGALLPGARGGGGSDVLRPRPRAPPAHAPQYTAAGQEEKEDQMITSSNLVLLGYFL